ncbi:aldo/keto reductase [Bacillus marinisedimentorum]|uniref:aldo/keto reductase n=1 Tax=Bacillus marinisedimentorum TaxID=1821260 RepID=UPI00082450D6|nr:aldo/keto reductase [Bacillus marinisedimentorum]
MRQTPWFQVPPIAMGTHLGDMTESDSALYRKSLSFGLMNGINMIDTALNYRGMKSERDIGAVLNMLLVDSGQLKREQIIISTKAGIIPGDIDAKLVPKDYLEKILYKQNIISPADVNSVDHHRHVLAPDYFQFAIEQSRKHLNLETIDIYYLHNPEISMMTLGAESFYKKLQALFSFFEIQIEKKRIRFYGMAAWDAFLLHEGNPGYISLEKVVETARSVAGESHHFKFLQTPYNHFKQEAGNLANQKVKGKSYTLFQSAEQQGIFVTTSAPFHLGKVFEDGVSSRKALSDIIQTPGILSAMVGMKQDVHMKENIKTLHELPAIKQ